MLLSLYVGRGAFSFVRDLVGVNLPHIVQYRKERQCLTIESEKHGGELHSVSPCG